MSAVSENLLARFPSGPYAKKGEGTIPSYNAKCKMKNVKLFLIFILTHSAAPSSALQGGEESAAQG
jgi:hypothetical protein